MLGATLLGLEKFYDTIPLTRLCREARRLGYKPALVRLGVLLCIGSWQVRYGSCFSRPVAPNSSILASLDLANNFARAVLRDAVLQQVTGHPQVSLRTFVDDDAGRVTSSSPRQALLLHTALRKLASVSQLDRSS